MNCVVYLFNRWFPGIYFFQIDSYDIIMITEESLFLCGEGAGDYPRRGKSLDRLPDLSWALSEHLRGSLPCPRVPRQCDERCLLLLPVYLSNFCLQPGLEPAQSATDWATNFPIKGIIVPKVLPSRVNTRQSNNRCSPFLRGEEKWKRLKLSSEVRVPVTTCY